jgi:hypothetical protein
MPIDRPAGNRCESLRIDRPAQIALRSPAMRSVWLLAIAASGCRSLLGIEEPVLETPAVDAPAVDVDAPVVCAWQLPSFDPCDLGVPIPALQLAAGSYVYDTSTAGGELFEVLPDMTRHTLLKSNLTLAQADDSRLAVLSVDALTIDEGATLRVTGIKPLLVVSWSAIVVNGAIDASSHLVVTNAERRIDFGAGANVGCGDNVGKDGIDVTMGSGSGGGGGGGFQGAGGAASAGGATTGGVGGTAVSAPVLHGGCGGGRSGIAGPNLSVPASTQSQGGAGGGAIRLIAHDSIVVAGSISANGAGGAGGPTSSSCGGGGGGSGGDIELEAPSLTITGILAANGGGGGGGGNTTDTEHGTDGADGVVGDVAASGGAIAPSGCGASGGDGSAETLSGQDASAPSACGGGGGGGGAGFIFVASPGFTPASSAKISPAISIRP